MKPNTLYQLLIEALEELMAPRVVSRVVRDGLSEAGATPDSVDLLQAETLLKGAVFRQLQTTRPADQARAVVADLIASARAMMATAVLPPTAAPNGPKIVAGAGLEPTTSDGEDALRLETGGDDGPIVDRPTVPEERTPPPDRRFPTDPALDARLRALRGALRPLNLYFGWAEVRKLRAQVQLIEDEEQAGRDPTALVTEAEAQLAVVGQKLEDQLVLQARDLADLEESIEVVAALGGNRVRRLESLVATVRDAQAQRTVAEAEVERAQKLARDLRRLIESSVLDDGEPPPDLGRGDGRPTRRFEPGRTAPTAAGRPAVGDADDATDADTAAEVAEIDPTTLSPEASERLRALDVDGERHALQALVTHHAEVLRYAPDRAADVAAIAAAHEAQRPAGEALATLTATLEADEKAHRDAVRGEFRTLLDELETWSVHVDVTDLRRAVRVVLDVVDDALPPLDDVTAARDLHAELSERVAAEARGAAELERRAADLREQRAELRDRLDQALGRGRGLVADTANVALRQAFDDLAAARASLEEAAEAGAEPEAGSDEMAVGSDTMFVGSDTMFVGSDTMFVGSDTVYVGSDMLERARDAEAVWERTLADASDDRSERRRARARELGARLGRLPDLPVLRARKDALQGEVTALERQPDLTDAHVRTLGSIVDQLVADARAATARRLDELAREAGDPAPDVLLRTLQAAARTLDEGGFPDLAGVEAEVRRAGDERRVDLRRRYLRARQESRRLGPAGVPASEALEALVDAARKALETDVAAEEAVDRLEAALTVVEHEVAERLAGFEERLDAALATFQRVARLNNDDVAAARRVLHHLDGQRAAVSRVSLGLQARLFESLADAEGRLAGLVDAFEATREIADRLVAGNLLDDVLGSFDTLFGSIGDASAEADESPNHAGLTTLLHAYLDLDAVTGAVVLDARGSVLTGWPDPDTDVTSLAHALRAAVAPWADLGGRFGDDVPEVAVIDDGGRATLVTSLAELGHAVVWTRDRGTSWTLGRKLRDDRPTLVALLGTAPSTVSDPGHGAA